MKKHLEICLSFVHLLFLLTLLACGKNSNSNFPNGSGNTNESNDSALCSGFYARESDLTSQATSCTSDSDCISAAVLGSLYSFCTDGQLPVNKAADLTPLLALESQIKNSCNRVSVFSCPVFPSNSKAVCSNGGTCQFVTSN